MTDGAKNRATMKGNFTDQNILPICPFIPDERAKTRRARALSVAMRGGLHSETDPSESIFDVLGICPIVYLTGNRARMPTVFQSSCYR